MLHLRIDEIEGAISHKMSILSPIRCVPPEMLSYIFAFLDPPSLPHELKTLKSYMLVCELWSQVIRRIPELWTCFSLALGLDRADLDRMLSMFPSHPM